MSALLCVPGTDLRFKDFSTRMYLSLESFARRIPFYTRLASRTPRVLIRTKNCAQEVFQALCHTSPAVSAVFLTPIMDSRFEDFNTSMCLSSWSFARKMNLCVHSFTSFSPLAPLHPTVVLTRIKRYTQDVSHYATLYPQYHQLPCSRVP